MREKDLNGYWFQQHGKLVCFCHKNSQDVWCQKEVTLTVHSDLQISLPDFYWGGYLKKHNVRQPSSDHCTENISISLKGKRNNHLYFIHIEHKNFDSTRTLHILTKFLFFFFLLQKQLYCQATSTHQFRLPAMWAILCGQRVCFTSRIALHLLLCVLLTQQHANSPKLINCWGAARKLNASILKK